VLNYRPILLIVVLVTSTVAGPTAKDKVESRDLAKYPVRFAILGDRTGEAQPGVYEQIVARIERLKPDFVMTVGDMVEGPAPDKAALEARWLEYKSIVEPLSAPIHFTPGNNDLSTDDDVGAWISHTGNLPYYSMDIEGLHFIVLDNSRWITIEEFPDEQISWLINDLDYHADAGRTFVFLHVPFWYRTVADARPDTLHNIFAKYGVDGVFTGHFHRYFTGEFDGVKYTGVGSSGGAAEPHPGDLDYHFVWVTVSDKEVSIAPMQINGVREWEAVSVADVRHYETMRSRGISFPSVASVSESPLRVNKATVEADICNLGDESLIDTIRWSTPEGWTVRPANMAVEVDSGETKRVRFEVECSGDLYPLPVISFGFPYKDGVCSAQKPLRVARQAVCVSADTTLAIDGVLDEKWWKRPCSGILDGSGKPAVVDKTEFYFAYDTDNLYLAARCVESRPDSLSAARTAHDDLVYQEDCVGFLYRPNGQEGSIYQLYVNPLGTTYDQEITCGTDGHWGGNQSWDGEYEVATKVLDNVWTVEVRIPLDQFGVVAEKGQVWDFNFRRKQKRLDAAGGWQIPHGYDPNGFGQLVMR